MNPKPSAIIFIKSASLEIYSEDIEGNTPFIFVKSCITHLEIKDKDEFVNQLSEFIKHIKPQTGIVLLSDEVIFQKEIDINSETLEESESFFEKIPFEKNNVARMEIKTNSKIFLFSTNRELYETITEVFVSNGWSIKIVAPATLFPDLAQKNTLTGEEVKEILKSGDALEKGNFIAGKEFIPSESDEASDKEDNEVTEKGKGVGIKKIAVVLIALILLGSFGYGAYWFRQSFSQKKTPAQEAINQALDIVETSPSATPVPTVKKEELTAQVLNGSGTSGLAAKIKNSLLDVGFKNIETGNFTGDNIADTTASFSGRVSEKERQEVKNVLDEFFASVILGESRNAKYDVAITTGTKLK